MTEMSDISMSDVPNGRDTADAQATRQRRRSVAIALSLFAMAVMFFVVTIVQLKSSVGTDRFAPVKEKKIKTVPIAPSSPTPKSGG